MVKYRLLPVKVNPGCHLQYWLITRHTTPHKGGMFCQVPTPLLSTFSFLSFFPCNCALLTLNVNTGNSLWLFPFWWRKHPVWHLWKQNCIDIFESSLQVCGVMNGIMLWTQTELLLLFFKGHWLLGWRFDVKQSVDHGVVTYFSFNSDTSDSHRNICTRKMLSQCKLNTYCSLIWLKGCKYTNTWPLVVNLQVSIHYFLVCHLFIFNLWLFIFNVSFCFQLISHVCWLLTHSRIRNLKPKDVASV